MNKQALFTNAHRIARSIAAAVGNYMVAFKLALKQAWSEIKMTIEFTTGVAANGKDYVEAAAGTVNIGDTFTKEFRVDAKPLTKKMIRLGIEGHPAATVIRTYTVTGAGQAFTVGDPMKGEKKQRFYCEMQEQRIYDAE